MGKNENHIGFVHKTNGKPLTKEEYLALNKQTGEAIAKVKACGDNHISGRKVRENRWLCKNCNVVMFKEVKNG